MSDLVRQIDELVKEAGALRNSDPEKSISLLTRGIALATPTRDLLQLTRCHLGIGLTHQSSSRFQEALKFIMKAHEYANELKNEESLSDVYTGFGNVYFYMNDLDRSLKFHLDSLKLREKGKDQNRLAFAINSIGVVYASMKDYTKAAEYFSRSLEMNKQLNNVFGIRMAMNNIGVAAYENKEYQKAIQVLSSALPGSELLVNDTIQLEILTNLGEAYRDSGEHAKSEEHLLKALDILKGRKNIAEARVYLALAKLRLAQSRVDDADQLCTHAIEMYEQMDLKEMASRSWRLMAEIRLMQNNSAAARLAMDRFIALNESLHMEEMRKKTQNLSLIYEAEKLQKENEIHYLKNVELKKAYDEVGVANQNLTDSIQYARHIQEVIFNKHLVAFRTCFPESFYLNLPKDIVSGDFIWFHDFGDHVILALADCTGHGVPGAFLSMLGNDLMNKAVIEKQIHSPERIAEYLHLSLREYFPEKELAPKQGMDILIGKLSKKGNLSWAGARGMGILFRKGEFPKEMKGDRVFLGSTLMHEFQLWEAEMERGDRLFFYTDGWVDQKGPSGKKFGRQGLESILSQERPMRKLESSLRSAIDLWRSGKPQLDDMMILGLEVR